MQLNGQAEARTADGAEAKASNGAMPSATAHKIKTRKVAYLWDRRLALGVATLLTGESEQGKSTLASRIVASLTVGEALPGGPRVEACHTAILTAEEHPATAWKSRLTAAGADLKRVHFPGWDDAGVLVKRIRLPSMGNELRDYLIERRIRLLVIDPIGSFLDLAMLEDNGHTAREVMQTLTDAVSAASCAALVVKHPRKGNAGSPLDQVSGSKEWINQPRSVLVVGPHPNAPEMRVMASLKCSFGPKPSSLSAGIDFPGGASLWSWTGETPLTAGDVFAGESDPLGRSLLAEAKALLIDRLDAEEQPSKDMLQAGEDAGLSNMTMQRAKKQLGVTSHPKGPNEKRFHVWRKPSGGWPKTSAG